MEQHQAVSNVMMSTECTSYDEQMPKRRALAQSKGKKQKLKLVTVMGAFDAFLGI